MSRTLFELDADTKRKAQHKALDMGVSLAEVMRDLIAGWLAGEITLSFEDDDGQISGQPGNATD